jgi:hypothetical protein
MDSSIVIASIAAGVSLATAVLTFRAAAARTRPTPARSTSRNTATPSTGCARSSRSRTGTSTGSAPSSTGCKSNSPGSRTCRNALRTCKSAHCKIRSMNLMRSRARLEDMLSATTPFPRERQIGMNAPNTPPVEADARNRAFRTLLQGLGLDLAAGVATALVAGIAGGIEWTNAYWVALGLAVAKSALPRPSATSPAR